MVNRAGHQAKWRQVPSDDVQWNEHFKKTVDGIGKKQSPHRRTQHQVTTLTFHLGQWFFFSYWWLQDVEVRVTWIHLRLLRQWCGKDWPMSLTEEDVGPQPQMETARFSQCFYCSGSGRHCFQFLFLTGKSGPHFKMESLTGSLTGSLCKRHANRLMWQYL